MDMDKLKLQYSTQNNRGTAYPIYVQVQEQVCIGVIANGYSPLCPFGDDEIKLEHDCDSCSDSECRERGETGEPSLCHEDVRCGYIWHPVEFFLTIKGAEEYIKYNQHNHGKLRVYVAQFERHNFEMHELLTEIGLKE